MPSERRRILFTDDEIVEAVISHCRATGIAVPHADVESLEIDRDSDCALTLTFAVASPDQSDQIHVDSDTLLAALVSYCRLAAIPLPRAIRKHLEPKDGCLSMVISTDRPRGSVKCSFAA